MRLFTYDSRKLRKTAQGETLEIYAISQRYQDCLLYTSLTMQKLWFVGEGKQGK